ncbi:unnamed protein product, partial [Mesorhabditis belari]|uniref:Protein kinase domain-containing protein n=1 Tax=Mesorhabditis belari TaxID=2138241 RepID=A0AAF3FNB8_9BILA
MSSKIEIGRGTFGIVFLETDFHPVTASKYILKSSDPKIEQTFQREWEALKLLSHPNIVQVYELSEEDFCGKPYHVIKMEFCVRGSLRQVINNRKIIYSMKTFSCWAEHLLAGLVCLENHGIIHRDLKPENVLVTRDWILKIGDFGCVRRENDTKELSKDGTLRYMSPECAGFGMATGKRKVTCKSDLYASGLIMWEILERRCSF